MLKNGPELLFPTPFPSPVLRPSHTGASNGGGEGSSEGELPGSVWETLREVSYSTGILTVVFFTFAALCVLLTHFLKRILAI